MLVAIDRSTFNYIFKYNSATISKSQILNLSNDIIEFEIDKQSEFIVSEINRILPIFELDHEVLILEIEETGLLFNGEIILPFKSILKVYPLTERGKNILMGKLNQGITLSEAKFQEIVEKVKILRAVENRETLYQKLSKICLNDKQPNHFFSKNVKNIIERLILNQDIGNFFLANLIQYNYNPSDFSSGNIEIFEKIGIIAWISTNSSIENYTTSNYFRRCEDFKLQINEGNYVDGYRTYVKIIKYQSPDFKNSHDRLNEIINEGFEEIDLFKISYYFLTIKTKLNKNNSNLLDLFEDLVRDIYSDPVTMSYVLYLISYSFSFEQLYESVHFLERSALLKSKVLVRDADAILNDIENEKLKQIKDEEERIRIEDEKQKKVEEEERNRIGVEKSRQTQEEDELDDERIKMLIQSHTPVDDNESASDSNLLETKNVEIEIGKTIELDIFDNSENVNDQDLKDSNDSTKNENEGSDQQESSTEVSEPSLEYQISDNNKIDNHLDKNKEVKSQNSDDFIENKEDNSDNPNLQKNGYKEVNAENEKIKDNIMVEKPKRGKSTRPKTTKIIQKDKLFIDSEMNISNIEDSKNQNVEINPDQSNGQKINSLTVEIFESFLLEFLKSSRQNKEKVKLWTDLMSTYFKEPSMEITLDILMAQMKYKPYAKDLMFESESEIELIENFFKTYNQ